MSTMTTATVPAAATGPVWQPWVAMQNAALSAFKTDITKNLSVYTQDLADAQKVLNAAQTAAAGVTASLQAQAIAAYQQGITEAARLYDSIMKPALQAYETAAKAAHTKLWEGLGPAENAYAQAALDAQWTQGLATGGAKVGTEPPLPGT